jgi:succinyl-CoA:acetate CoA-transferase
MPLPPGLTVRLQDPRLHAKVMGADEAAALIAVGANVGMSGFTGAAYLKAVPQALAARLAALHAAGQTQARIGLWTGASTGPELDGALARAQGIEMRLPYQSDPTCRQQINAGHMLYNDMHLSHVAQAVWSGLLGHLDMAVVEVAGILPGGG